ncbi:UbiA prenyltransferase family [Suillus ampliporus]|nr:UbiA prenyltransferase family [Suillus ampliporus]
MSGFAATTLRSAQRYFETAWLFTKSDYKTIILPVIIFAAVLSPRHDMLSLSCTLLWVWSHLLQANVSNQTYSAHEDAMNHPWRPVPSGRISVKDCRTLRWGLMVFCLALSSIFGINVLISSMLLTVVEIVHDDFDLSHHPIFKNLCNVGGYATFELGATLVLCTQLSLTSMTALACSALVIVLTIHAQDFSDTNGDRMSGRRTLPIVAPEGSRIYMLCILPALSFILVSIWNLGPLCSIVFVSIGFGVGLRFFHLREEISDRSTYMLYNIWLMGAHLLPANARFCVLTW